MNLPELRKTIFENYYDNCFCDDVGQYPLCEGCVRVKEILALIDAQIEAPKEKQDAGDAYMHHAGYYPGRGS